MLFRSAERLVVVPVELNACFMADVHKGTIMPPTEVGVRSNLGLDGEACEASELLQVLIGHFEESCINSI